MTEANKTPDGGNQQEIELNLRRLEALIDQHEAANLENAEELNQMHVEQEELEKQIVELEKRPTTEDRLRLVQEKAAVDQELSTTKDQLKKIQNQLDEVTKKSRLYEETITENRKEIADLKKQLAEMTLGEMGVIDLEENLDEITDLSAHFKSYADSVFPENSAEFEPSVEANGKISFTDISRLEAGTHFLGEPDEEITERPGLYDILRHTYGSHLEFFGGERAGEEFLKKTTSQSAEDFSITSEVLSAKKSNLLRLQLILGKELLVGKKYTKGYRSHEYTKAFPFYHLTEQLNQDEENTKELYFNLGGYIPALEKIIEILDSIETNTSSEISDSIKKFLNGKQGKDLAEISANFPKEEDWKTKNIYGDEGKSEEDEKEKLIDRLEKLFKLSSGDEEEEEKEDAEIGLDIYSDLHEALGKLSILLSNSLLLSNFDSVGEKPENITLGDRMPEIRLEGARNIFSTLFSHMFDGEQLSEVESWTLEMVKRNGVPDNLEEWPPNSASLASPEVLSKIMKHEIPIDIYLNPDKPINILSGHNGAGKTHSMETLIQNLSHAHLMGGTPFAKVVRTSQLSEIQALISSSKHSEALSSFQRESALLKHSLEALLDKDPSEPALMVVDEVGKGTDSRDSLALMIAISEWCIRNNVYLVMATHHGRELLRMAQAVGLKNKISVLSPDFKTHQLIESEDFVESKGIEVLEERARDQGLEEGFLNDFIRNAFKIRESLLAKKQVEIEAVSIPEGTSDSLPFIDQSSMTDLGINPTDNPYALNTFGALLWGKEALRSWRYKKEAVWWEKEFINNFPDTLQNPNPEITQAIQTLTKIFKEDQEIFQAITSIIKDFAQFHTTMFVSDGDVDTKKERMNVEEWKNGEIGLGKSVYYGGGSDAMRSKISETVAITQNPQSRKDAIEKITILKERLKEVASNNPLILGFSTSIGEYLAILKETDPFFEEKRDLALETFSTGIYGGLASEIEKFSEKSHEPPNESDVVELKKAGVNVGVYENPKDFFQKLATAVRERNSRILTPLVNWVKKLDEYENFRSYGSNGRFDNFIKGTKAVVESLEKLGEVAFEKQKEIGIESDLEDEDQSNSALAITGQELSLNELTNLSEDDFKKTIIDKVLVGNPQMAFVLLEKLIHTDKSFEKPISGKWDYEKLTNLFLDSHAETFFAWHDRISEISDNDNEENETASTNPFIVLGLEPGKEYSDDAVKSIFRVLAQQYHPDVNKDKGAEDKIKEINEANSKIAKKSQRDLYNNKLSFDFLPNFIQVMTAAHSAATINSCIATESADGSTQISGAIPVGLVDKLGIDGVVPQSFDLKSKEDLYIIGGSNGNGKSQALLARALVPIFHRAWGISFAQSAKIPSSNFQFTAINAGESQAHKSSFQSEADRYIDLLKKYIEAGAPTEGEIYLDEPLAGTSSEDQRAIFIAFVAFFKSRGVKVYTTNHNHQMYESIRETSLPEKNKINFKPVAFMAKGTERFTLTEFDEKDTDQIRSDGLAVAAQFGVPETIMNLAFWVRQTLDEGQKDVIDSETIVAAYEAATSGISRSIPEYIKNIDIVIQAAAGIIDAENTDGNKSVVNIFEGSEWENLPSIMTSKSERASLAEIEDEFEKAEKLVEELKKIREVVKDLRHSIATSDLDPLEKYGLKPGEALLETIDGEPDDKVPFLNLLKEKIFIIGKITKIIEKNVLDQSEVVKKYVLAFKNGNLEGVEPIQNKEQAIAVIKSLIRTEQSLPEKERVLARANISTEDNIKNALGRIAVSLEKKRKAQISKLTSENLNAEKTNTIINLLRKISAKQHIVELVVEAL